MGTSDGATLRHVEPARDAASCASIYAPYVDDSAISFEEIAPDAAQMEVRIAAATLTHPWLVLEQGGEVTAFAYAGQHRTRAAYRWAAEVGIYVGPAHQRRGAGRRLYEALLDLLRRQNLRIACAGITLPNDASVGLHRALGFEPVGVQHEIGFKHGAWHDVSWWQLALAPGDHGPPGEPLEPQRLPER
ncbi:MAG: hypothetical protein QOI73_3589 [Solirubrobacteraceae bacterium]|nr:hypothetical protein [Solirubrobacteraceae bacterium]